MAGRPSLEDILEDVPHEKLNLWLNQPCSDDHLCEIALSISDWQSVAPFLGLTDVLEEQIERDYANTKLQRIAMLRTWRRKFGQTATYRALLRTVLRLGRADIAETVCDILVRSSSSSSDEDGPPAAKRSKWKITE